MMKEDDGHWCCRCGEWQDDDERERQLLIVAEPVDALGEAEPIAPGIYEIVAYPYYGGPIIGEPYLFDDALTLLTTDISGCNTEDYACGHLCASCEEEYRNADLGTLR